MFPRTGSTGVPTNARLLLIYGGTFRPAAANAVENTLELRTTDGAPVELVRAARPEAHRTIVTLKPVQPLAPNTRYELWDKYPVPCGEVSPNACAPATASSIASFQTGAGADTTAPTFTGLASAQAGERTIDETSCGPRNEQNVSLAWNRAEDAVSGADVMYLLRDGETETLLPGSDITHELTFACRDGERSARYRLHAVDWAGNVDTNTVERSAGTICEGPGGCSLGAGRAGAGWGWLAGALLVLGGVFRRARRRQ